MTPPLSCLWAGNVACILRVLLLDPVAQDDLFQLLAGAAAVGRDLLVFDDRDHRCSSVLGVRESGVHGLSGSLMVCHGGRTIGLAGTIINVMIFCVLRGTTPTTDTPSAEQCEGKTLRLAAPREAMRGKGFELQSTVSTAFRSLPRAAEHSRSLVLTHAREGI